MSGPESIFYQKEVKPRIKLWGTHDRIENAIGSGQADISYAYLGVQGWIELKVTKGNFIHFKKYQIPWLVTRAAHAYHVFLLVQHNEFIMLIHAERLLHATKVIKGKDVCIDYRDMIPLATGKTGGDPVFWRQVQETLGTRTLLTDR